MQELSNNYVNREGHNVPCGIQTNLPNFYFCFVKIYHIYSKLYKTWISISIYNLYKSIFFCIRMQTWMIGMLIKPQSFILYKHFFVFNKLPHVSNFVSPFFKISGQKNWKTFCRDQPLFLFHRFLHSKFSNRLYFTWTLFEKHIY